jgi:pimeloyl-ACP methyl ester carboxylesterase
VSGAPEPFEPRFGAGVLDQLRARLRATRWPRPAPGGWEWGVDVEYLIRLCAWWAEDYDPDGLLERLGAWPSYRWRGVHLHHVRSDGGGLPVLLLHGWPGAPLEFRDLIAPLSAAGHDVVVPTLPGYGFSLTPEVPPSAIVVAELLAELMATLGYRRYVVQGGDWGAFIGARLAFSHPDRVAGYHCSTPGVLPLPPDLGERELSAAEAEFARGARRLRQGPAGVHMLIQGQAPDTLGVGLDDSPAALAAWLVPRYRLLTDCGGELERRFTNRDLCDFLTFYWATGSAASALRLYAASAADRWRLRPGERIIPPVAVADFPADIARPPREWVERLLGDLRRWTPMPRGGHFGAFEEPDLLAADLLGFAAGLSAPGADCS